MNDLDLSFAFGAIGGFIKSNPWIGVATFVIWLAMRVIQSDIKTFPTVPARLRIFCLPVFTLLTMPVAFYANAGAAHPISWLTAILGSCIAAAQSVYFHEAVVNAIRKGKAIPLPWVTIVGAKPSPSAPATISATPSDQVIAPDPPPPPAKQVPAPEIPPLAESASEGNVAPGIAPPTDTPPPGGT